MNVYRHHNVFVILSGLLLTPQAQNFSLPKNINPHFDQTGTQRCNCKPNKQCQPNGTCEPDACAFPYVGITCQHVNLTAVLNSTNVPQELLDGSDTTCLKKPYKNPVLFETTHPMHFIWIYISRSLGSTMPVMPHLELYENNTLLSIDSYYMNINEKSFLIKLREDVMYDKLQLVGLPDDTCSLEVSIGRNLALSSVPYQSKGGRSKTDHKRKKSSKLAIDGFDEQTYHTATPYRFFCSYTSSTHSTAWWKTRLKHDAIVNLVGIINRNKRMCRLRHFILSMYKRDDRLAFEYSDQSNIDTHFYVVPIYTQEKIRTVKVSTGSRTKNTCRWSNAMTICEIYIYGEFSCPNNQYGPVCDRHCIGCSRDLCDPDWGCLGGCKKSWTGHWCSNKCVFKYGKKCQFDCPSNCGNEGFCNKTTGACLHGCKRGYFTPDCSKSCEPGHYDANCLKFCSFCKKNTTTGFPSCDPEFGQCYLGCDDDRNGDLCEQLIIRDPAYKVVAKYSLGVLACIFALYVMYRSFLLIEDAEEEGSSEQVGGKSFDAKDEIEEDEKVVIEPIAAIDKIIDEKEEVKMNSTAAEITQPKPIETDDHQPLDQLAGTSMGVLKITESDSTGLSEATTPTVVEGGSETTYWERIFGIRNDPVGDSSSSQENENQ